MKTLQQILALNISMRRCQLRKSQRQLAIASGVSTTMLCQIIKMDATPSLKTIERLAKGLEIDAYLLFKEDLYSKHIGELEEELKVELNILPLGSVK